MRCTACGQEPADQDPSCARCGAPVGPGPGGPPPWRPPGPHPDAAGSGGTRTWLVAAAASVVLLAGATTTYLVLDGLTTSGGPVGRVAEAGADGAAAQAPAPGSAPAGDPGPGGRVPATTAPATTATMTTPATTTPAGAPSSDDPATSFAALYARAADGVVRIETVSCDGDGVGSGFLLSPTLVATVEHVVDDAAVISLEAGGQRTTGVVIGSDPGRDLALVRTDRPLTGHGFTLATGQPEVGTRVAAIGFPLGDPITMTQGGISGLDRTVRVDGQDRPGLIQTDTPVNPGNSGGPLLTAAGEVVGLVDAVHTDANGIAYAVPATQAGPAFAAWRAAPRPQPAATCPGALGPGSGSDPGLDEEPAPGPLDALSDYFLGINTGDYAAAYAVLGPRLQAAQDLDRFTESTRTSYDTDVELLEVTERDDGVLVGLAFTSLQAPGMGPDGGTCTRWTLDYLLVPDRSGQWRIERATGRGGEPHRPC